MSFDSFKSSTVGPEALAARLELEKRQKEQREKDRALRIRDKERREHNLQMAMEDSKNYDTGNEGTGEVSPEGFPVLKRGNFNQSQGLGKPFTMAANNQPQAQGQAKETTPNGFRLKRF